jgi:hypothetical protein
MLFFLALEIIENDLDPEGDQGQGPKPGDLAECQNVEVDQLKKNADDQYGTAEKRERSSLPSAWPSAVKPPLLSLQASL